MIYIDEHSKIPVYQQIYEQFRDKILDRTLEAGSKLPSTRYLSKNLCVARNTVENAYNQLYLEGYVLSRPGSGFIVQPIADSLELDKREYINVRDVLEQRKKDHLVTEQSVSFHYDFQYGNLSKDVFPYTEWRKYTAEAFLTAGSGKITSYNDNRGELDLRIEIMKYLKSARGVNCTPAQVVVCFGIQYALDLVCQMLCDRYQTIAMEEPGYDAVRTIFQTHGFHVVPVPVKSDGIDIDELENTDAALTFITPSHQFPKGAVMPIQNRVRLLNWAVKNDGIILEDDYDSEFRYDARPIPSLQSIDGNGRVIYFGTFSKCISPDIRISYMVLPEWMLPHYSSVFERYHSSVSWLQQKVMQQFMANGHFERHVRKVCLTNKKKHDTLIRSIHACMGDRVAIHGNNAGLHILLEFTGGEDAGEMIKRAEASGVKVYPTPRYWMVKEDCPKNLIVMGFSLMNENEIEQGIAILAEAWFQNASAHATGGGPV